MYGPMLKDGFYGAIAFAHIFFSNFRLRFLYTFGKTFLPTVKSIRLILNKRVSEITVIVHFA